MEEKENEVKEENKDENLSKKEKESRKVNKLNEDLAKAQADMEHWKNEYYKAYADMANLRKDIQKDHQEVIKYRIEGFVDNLLGVLDAFDMAFKNEPANPETKNYLIGFKYVYSQLLEVLKGEGIEIIEPAINAKFDEKTMHAVDTVEDEGEEHLVKKVNLKGYKLYDHLIRPAMVVTSIKKKEVSDEKTNENKDEKVA